MMLAISICHGLVMSKESWPVYTAFHFTLPESGTKSVKRGCQSLARFIKSTKGKFITNTQRLLENSYWLRYGILAPPQCGWNIIYLGYAVTSSR